MPKSTIYANSNTTDNKLCVHTVENLYKTDKALPLTSDQSQPYKIQHLDILIEKQMMLHQLANVIF